MRIPNRMTYAMVTRLTCAIVGHRWGWWALIWTMYCGRCGKSWHPIAPPTSDDVARFGGQ